VDRKLRWTSIHALLKRKIRAAFPVLNYGLPQPISRAGQWFARSGIQESSGGVARYYRADLGCNNAVSTEITGYAVSTFVYLHSIAREAPFLEAALRAARFLTRTAWDGASNAMPFELGPPAFAYFFDCGIAVRGLLSAWRVTGEDEFLDVATALGESMAADFACGDGGFHAILSLPGKRPIPPDAARWSASPGCYQLKAAMAWHDLAEATGDSRFRELYERAVERSLGASSGFLPGSADPLKVVDRLHAFLYFLEGLLPSAAGNRCAAAIRDGIDRVARALREAASRFERCDVYAQLLRMRLYADWAGVTPLDREAAKFEAAKLAGFQASASDARIDGGFYFGRKAGAALPFVNPVATAFALQALALWEQCRDGGAQPHRHLLI
jgi:hypothetical protein